MSEKTELRECPFCGSDDVAYTTETQTFDGVGYERDFISCATCQASSGRVQGGTEEKRKAMLTKFWNTRAISSKGRAEAGEAQGWIEITDDLPAEIFLVWATIEFYSDGGHHFCNALYRANGKWLYEKTDSPLAENEKVIAYIPLPEPFVK